MNVAILTVDLATETEISELERDLFQSGSQRWLMNHIVWALNAGYGIQLTVKKEVDTKTKAA